MFVHILFVVITKQDPCGCITSGVSGDEANKANNGAGKVAFT